MKDNKTVNLTLGFINNGIGVHIGTIEDNRSAIKINIARRHRNKKNYQPGSIVSFLGKFFQVMEYKFLSNF